MKRIDDFFGSGVIIGSIGNVWATIFPLSINLFISDIGSPWNDLASLFFEPPIVYSFWSQLFGFLATFGVAITNGVIVGGFLKFTGRDFAYIKSIVICTGTSMIALIMYPLLGLTTHQYSWLVTYLIVINNQVFAVIVAYLFLRFTTVGLRKPEKEQSNGVYSKFRFVPHPARKKEKTSRDIRFVKPKRL